MNNFFKMSRFWTFEQIGSRQDQMYKYLGQVNSEMFKSSLHRNIIGTISSFPIHYYGDPIVSSFLLLGVGLVQIHSIYKHKQCTNILGYYKDQKHLLKGINPTNLQEQSTKSTEGFASQFSKESSTSNQNFGTNNEENTFANASSRTQTNYEKYISNSQSSGKQQAASDFSSDQFTGQTKEEQIRYIEVENTEERMKYYNRQLFCMGLLQGLFLGSYIDIWNEGYIYATHLAVFMNTVLNGFVFQHFYQSNYNMTTLKAMLIGSVTPLPLCLVAPVFFNNGFIQSNLLKQAQKLFLSEHINQDPSSFLMQRTGIRSFGLFLFYLVTLSVLLGDEEEDEHDDVVIEDKDGSNSFIEVQIETDDDHSNSNNNDSKKKKSSGNWIMFKIDDGHNINKNIEILRRFNAKQQSKKKEEDSEEKASSSSEEKKKK